MLNEKVANKQNSREFRQKRREPGEDGRAGEREREREKRIFHGEKSRSVKFNRAGGDEGNAETKPSRAANFYDHTLFGSQATYNFRNPVRELPPPKSERVRDFNMYLLSRLKLAPEFLKRAFHRPPNGG